MERPRFVFSLDKPAKLLELLPKADVVVLACPLTKETRGLIGPKQFAAMKKSAYLHQRRPRRPGADARRWSRR